MAEESNEAKDDAGCDPVPWGRLRLSRYCGQRIRILDTQTDLVVWIKVAEIGEWEGQPSVTLVISAPTDVNVIREELLYKSKP